MSKKQYEPEEVASLCAAAIQSEQGEVLIEHLKEVAHYNSDNLSLGCSPDTALQVFTLHRLINYIERLPERVSEHGVKALTDNLQLTNTEINE